MSTATASTAKLGKATTVKGILRGAKRLIQSKGWVQSVDVASGKSAFCARGALAVATGIPLIKYQSMAGETFYDLDFYALQDNKAYQEAKALCDAVAATLESDDNYGYCDVVDYNDYPGRTVEEVVAIFDEALARA